jgi:hypothetical protein
LGFVSRVEADFGNLAASPVASALKPGNATATAAAVIPAIPVASSIEATEVVRYRAASLRSADSEEWVGGKVMEMELCRGNGSTWWAATRLGGCELSTICIRADGNGRPVATSKMALILRTEKSMLTGCHKANLLFVLVDVMIVHCS